MRYVHTLAGGVGFALVLFSFVTAIYYATRAPEQNTMSTCSDSAFVVSTVPTRCPEGTHIDDVVDSVVICRCNEQHFESFDRDEPPAIHMPPLVIPVPSDSLDTKGGVINI